MSQEMAAGDPDEGRWNNTVNFSFTLSV
jgi:hypothetical protein